MLKLIVGKANRRRSDVVDSIKHDIDDMISEFDWHALSLRESRVEVENLSSERMAHVVVPGTSVHFEIVVQK